MKNFKGTGSASKVRTPGLLKKIDARKQTLTSPGATSDNPLVVDEIGVTIGNSNSLEQGNKRPRRNIQTIDQSGVDAEEEARRIQAEADAQLHELGVLPFMNDLAACKRVGYACLDLFRKVYSEYPTQLAQALIGKINSSRSKTRHIARPHKTVQAKLDSQRTDWYTHLSLENRDLKEKVSQLEGVKIELAKVRQEITMKNKQLEELPSTKAEAERGQKSEKTLREKSAALKASIEKLKQEKAATEERVKQAGA